MKGLCVLVCFFSLAKANPGKELQIAVLHGFSAPHRPVLKGIITDRTSFLECTYMVRGKQSWQNKHHYPAAGCAFLYGSLGNPHVLGNVFAIYPYLQFFPIDKPKVKLIFGMGLGLSWHSDYWKLKDNYSNVALSLPIASSILFRLGFNRQITNKVLAGCALGLNHFSNGSSKQPNLGLNNLSLRFSLAYRLAQLTQKEQSLLSDSLTKSREWFLFIGAFPKQVTPVLGSVYLPISLSFGYSGTWGRRWAWSAGTDFFYDSSLRHEINHDNPSSYNPLTVFQTGIFIGTEYRYNRLVIPIQTGVYVFDKVNFHGPVYSRFGMRIKLHGPLWYSVMLKSHFEKADFIEMGFGLRWK